MNQSAGGRVLVLQEEGGRSETSTHTTVTQTEGEGPGQQVQRRQSGKQETKGWREKEDWGWRDERAKEKKEDLMANFSC